MPFGAYKFIFALPSKVIYAEAFETKPRGAMAIYNLTNAYSDYTGDYKRGFMLGDDRNTLTIRDEINLFRESDLVWNMITKADIEISEDKKSAYLTQNGKKLLVKDVVLDVKPKENTAIDLKIPERCYLGAYVHCVCFDETGYELAHIQLELPVKIEPSENLEGFSDFVQDNNCIVFYGDNFRYTFSKHLGTFTSFIKNGEEQICAPLRLTTMRAPTDNERRLKSLWYWSNPWEGENLDRQFDKVYKCDFGDGVIRVHGSLSGVSRTPYFRYNLEYSVYSNGTIQVKLTGRIKDRCIWLPRLGFEFKIPKTKERFTYYGMGPHESYVDMHHGSAIDFYSSNVRNEYVNYVKPQEHGNHIKTKILNIENGLSFKANDVMDINVSLYDALTLMNTGHSSELMENDNITVRIDYKNSGIGSNSCGPELLQKYRLDEKEIDFNFSIM